MSYTTLMERVSNAMRLGIRKGIDPLQFRASFIPKVLPGVRRVVATHTARLSPHANRSTLRQVIAIGSLCQLVMSLHPDPRQLACNPEWTPILEALANVFHALWATRHKPFIATGVYYILSALQCFVFVLCSSVTLNDSFASHHNVTTALQCAACHYVLNSDIHVGGQGRARSQGMLNCGVLLLAAAARSFQHRDPLKLFPQAAVRKLFLSMSNSGVHAGFLNMAHALQLCPWEFAMHAPQLYLSVSLKILTSRESEKLEQSLRRCDASISITARVVAVLRRLRPIPFHLLAHPRIKAFVRSQSLRFMQDAFQLSLAEANCILNETKSVIEVLMFLAKRTPQGWFTSSASWPALRQITQLHCFFFEFSANPDLQSPFGILQPAAAACFVRCNLPRDSNPNHVRFWVETLRCISSRSFTSACICLPLWKSHVPILLHGTLGRVTRSDKMTLLHAALNVFDRLHKRNQHLFCGVLHTSLHEGDTGTPWEKVLRRVQKQLIPYATVLVNLMPFVANALHCILEKAPNGSKTVEEAILQLFTRTCRNEFSVVIAFREWIKFLHRFEAMKLNHKREGSARRLCTQSIVDFLERG